MAKNLFSDKVKWLVRFVVILSLFSFSYTVKSIFYCHKNTLDTQVLNYATNHVNPTVTHIMGFFSSLGNVRSITIATLVLSLYFFSKKDKKAAITVPYIILTATFIIQILKNFFKRPRPLTPLLEKASGFSFPSGHTVASVTLYGLILYFIWKNPTKYTFARWVCTIFLILTIIMVGVSRIYLREHYASDVIGGYSVGIAWLLISIRIISLLKCFNKPRV